MNCITCNQQLPKDTTEHPHYFAQYKLNSEPDDYGNFADELKQLLQYMEAVLGTLLEPQTKDDDMVFQLHLLARALGFEAQHRLDLIVDAAELWEQRAKARKEGSHGA